MKARRRTKEVVWALNPKASFFVKHFLKWYHWSIVTTWKVWWCIVCENMPKKFVHAIKIWQRCYGFCGSIVLYFIVVKSHSEPTWLFNLNLLRLHLVIRPTLLPLEKKRWGNFSNCCHEGLKQILTEFDLHVMEMTCFFLAGGSASTFITRQNALDHKAECHGW